LIKSTINDDLLAIDVGWPCSLLEYQKGIKSIGLKYKNIKWAIVTHFHMDHAGLINEFQKNGIECIVFENQYEHIDLMEKTISRKYNNYTSINKEKLKRITTNVSKEYFNDLGIELEIIKTNGHSEDSISVIKNDEIIIGDLAPIDQIMDDDIKNQICWEKIINRKIRKVYPSHAKEFYLE
jgi:glyoxylase-like metal-dependent hydrolase (beta-lactamase superfamily II)